MPTREIYERNTAIAAQRVRELILDGIENKAFRDVPTAFIAEVVSSVMVRIQQRVVARSRTVRRRGLRRPGEPDRERDHLAVTGAPPIRRGPSARNRACWTSPECAGVAIGTVSNVINQPNKVAEATRARVQRAIDELGFVRNGTAGASAKGTSNTIGFVTIDLGNTFFLDMARGAEDEARAQGKWLLLGNSDVDLSRQDSYLSLFNEERVAGILLAPLPHALAHAERVRAHGRPVVVVNGAFDDPDSCSVLVDNEHGGYLAAKHLIDGGRTRIAFVGPIELSPVDERYVGVARAVAETGGSVELEHIATAEVQTEDGREVGLEIAGRPRPQIPDGIVAAADLLAVGILQSLLATGTLSVPRDVAIIGYDNNRMAWDTPIPISTVSQPGREMGKIASQLLLEEILMPESHVHRRIILEPALIARWSTVGD